jgi:hypothetical protein
MDINLSEDFKEKIESQLKQKESEIQKEKDSTLYGLECMMEEATDNKEILSLVKQCDEAEKKFEQEQINHRRKTVKSFVNELSMLTKHIKKVYSKELKNK